MRDYLIAMLVIPVLFIVWGIVQRITRQYALKHPELGPPREEGAGCGSSCLCGSRSACKNRNKNKQ